MTLGAHEKFIGMNLLKSYPEPTLVLRVRSPRRVGDNLSEGNRQISPVSSV